MRIKFNKSTVLDVEYFDVCIGTDNETISASLYLDGKAYRDWLTPYCAKANGEFDTNYCLFGEWHLGEFYENWEKDAEKFANEITTKMLEQGYIDLDKYDNFSIY